ncbi:MAG: PEGA domain-containing protein [FCB group bacterium]|nr:PEGA domain-containing protein [FCB group bacterium]
MRKVFVLLFAILCISLLAQELNELSIVGKAVKTNDIVSSSIKDVNNRKASCIIFLTDLDVDMDFKPNIELVKLISNTGRHEVYVQPGERVIEVLASGFKPLNLVLSSYGISKLESGDVYQIEITGEKINNLIPVNFIIEPSGAEIFVDGTSKGEINNIQISAGKHTFKIVKEGYQTIEKEEDITINNTLLRFELTEQMYVAVTIKTTPDGATIYLDGTKATVTPKPFFYPDGNYTIRIEKESYETIEESITISSPQTNKNYTLEDIRASLTIKTHPNATVYINEESYKGGVSDLKLSPQIVQIRVEMPKAETITKDIVLKKKDTIVEELFPEVETGKVIVNTIPVDAEIVLTGDGGEKYTSKKPTTFKDVPIGKYELSIKAKGYKTHEESFKVKTNETAQKRIVIEEGSDKIDKEKNIKTEKSQVKQKGNFFDLYTYYSVSDQDFGYDAPINILNPLYIQYQYKHTLDNYKISCFLNYRNDLIAFGIHSFDEIYSYNSQMISVNTVSKYFLNKLFCITLDVNAYYLNGKVEWKEIEYKYESERNYGTFNSGLGVEEEKDIHLLTPKHKFKKGIFAYANYSAYLWKTIDGYPIEENPKYIYASIEYAYLHGVSNLMVKPFFHYYFEIESELYTSTIGLNFLWDISRLAQLQIDLTDSFYKNLYVGHSIEDEDTNNDFSFNSLINFFPQPYIDIYLNYNLSTYDSNYDGQLNEKDKMASTFGVGLGLFWGYN